MVKIEGGQTIIAANKKPPKVFKFDHSYDSSNLASDGFASQEVIYNDLGAGLLDRAFDGYNCCIFAYGQTGSGKSHTMMGKDDKGLIPRICDALFNRLNSLTDVSCRVECSYLEIYNEKVRDLLSPRSTSLRVREHPSTGPYVEDLSKMAVASYNDVERLLDQGTKSRTTASTAMNETSSRSHAVFSITLTQRRNIVGLDTEKTAKISLVDLAGSERVHSTGAVGTRLKEGAEINKSLSTLGRVISALADRKLVPYRDSVLTWLLKDSLGGNSMTAMIATISPADINYDETLSTLRYADSAKRIKNHAVVNEDQNLKMIRELREELANLRAQMSSSTDKVLVVASDGGDQQISKAELAERMEQSSKLMDEINQSWEEKLERTRKLQQEREEALAELGIIIENGSIGLGTPKKIPHLVNLSEDPLFTECLLYNLKPGRTSCGNMESFCDIKLSGASIKDHHCTFVNIDNVVSVESAAGATVMVNGLRLTEQKRLRPGYRIIFGDEAKQIFRFNHPEEARIDRAAKSPTPMTVQSPSSQLNDYLAAHQDYPNIGDVSDQDDAGIDQLFDDLQRVKLGRRLTQASPLPQSDGILSESPSRLGKQSSMSSLVGSDADLPVPMSLYDELSATKKKRHSDSERLIQLINAEQLQAESRGSSKRSSVMERLAEAKIQAEACLNLRDAERQLQIARKVVRRWREYHDVRLARELLGKSKLLKQAQILSQQLNLDTTYQFNIRTHHNMLSPMEEDPVFESLEQDRPALGHLVAQVSDRQHDVVYFLDLPKLQEKVTRASRMLDSMRDVSLSRQILRLRPSPCYSLVGSSALPLLASSKASVNLIVFSSHNFIHTANLQVAIEASILGEGVQVDLNIIAIQGISEKEVTDLHVHAYFEKSPNRHLTTKLISGFGVSKAELNSMHTCKLELHDVPDIIHFQVFGLAQPAYFERMSSWDDLQNYIPATQQETIMCNITMLELDSAGIYSPVDVLSSDDPGFFHIHQGLSRRLQFEIISESNSDAKIVAVSVSKVRSINLKSKDVLIGPAEETVILKRIQSDSLFVAQWDSSVHNTKALDQTTPTDQIVIMTILMTLRTHGADVDLHADVQLRVQGRDQQTGFFSRLFSGYRTLETITQVYLVHESHLARNIQLYDSASQWQEAGNPLNWQPRGLNLLKDYQTMKSSQQKAMDLQRMLMMNDAPATDQDVERSSTLDIINYWSWVTKVKRPIDLEAQVLASYHDTRRHVIRAILLPPITRQSHLYVQKDEKWVKYYFVLRGTYLIQYKSSYQTSPRSLTDVSRLRAIPVSKTTFQFSPTQSFQASSEDSAIQWCKAINSI